MKRILLTLTALGLVLGSATARAEDSVDARIAKLEKAIGELKGELNAEKQKQKIATRKQEVEEEKAKDVASKNASVEIGKSGLKITSPDKRFQVGVKGYAQADSRTFFDNSNVSNVDQFLIRSARVNFEGKYDDFSARITPDFGNNNVRLVDAYADYAASKPLNVRVGKFKTPVGLERWQSETDTQFVERALPTNLVPFRDIGAQVSGELVPQTLEYQVSVTNGAVDLGDNNSDADNSKDVTGRVFAHPFRSGAPALQGLGVGVAGSYGVHSGTATSPNLTDGYRTPSQAKFFTYLNGNSATATGTSANTAIADGAQWRFNPQLYYAYGSFGILSEYVVNSQDITKAGANKSLKNDAWSAAVSYVLTGEDASFDGVRPRQDFSLSKGTWGAFELLARYGQLHVDKATFPTYADITKSAREADESTVGATWYLNSNVKVNLDYSYTDFTGGAAGGRDREAEQAALTRVQFKF